MKLTLKSLKGEKVELDVSDDITVDEFRVAAEATQNLPEDKTLRLVFAGHVMENGKTLNSYNVVDGNTVIILPTVKKTPIVQPSEPVNQVIEPFIQNNDSDMYVINLPSMGSVDDPEPGIPVAGVPGVSGGGQAFMQALMQDPQMQLLQQSNPEAFQQFINTNPMIQQFAQIGEQLQQAQSVAQQLQLTEDDDANLTQISNILPNLDPGIVLENYIACDRNVEATINLLFQSM